MTGPKPIGLRHLRQPGKPNANTTLAAAENFASASWPSVPKNADSIALIEVISRRQPGEYFGLSFCTMFSLDFRGFFSKSLAFQDLQDFIPIDTWRRMVGLVDRPRVGHFAQSN
jgi:hypothetical protein